jgi:hypothetical protein
MLWYFITLSEEHTMGVFQGAVMGWAFGITEREEKIT